MIPYDGNLPPIPARDALIAAVAPRAPCPSRPVLTEERLTAPAGASDYAIAPRLSPLAEAFLRHAAQSKHQDWDLECRWRALGIASGSEKERVLSELRRCGFLRLSRRGRTASVHLYPQAWYYLGMKPPASEGDGGPIHQRVVCHVAAAFKKRGYDVHIEQEIGLNRKRVDVVCYGAQRIGVEVGISDVRQELKNLRADLGAGVLDLILFVSPDPKLLARLQAMAREDTVVRAGLGHIRFMLFKEETAT